MKAAKSGDAARLIGARSGIALPHSATASVHIKKSPEDVAIGSTIGGARQRFDGKRSSSICDAMSRSGVRRLNRLRRDAFARHAGDRIRDGCASCDNEIHSLTACDAKGAARNANVRAPLALDLPKSIEHDNLRAGAPSRRAKYWSAGIGLTSRFFEDPRSRSSWGRERLATRRSRRSPVAKRNSGGGRFSSGEPEHLRRATRGHDDTIGQILMTEALRGDESGDGRTIERIEGARSGLALRNMRGFAVLVLLAFHSVLAYLGSLSVSAFPFDESPYQWRAFPIVDSQRWFGFDIFCAWQDVYLMSLMFFLSGLFTCPSLARKGSRRFLGGRLLRLGAPFVFGLLVVTPLALYPAYRLTAIDPSPITYVRHFLALPFWPNGPMWFLWLLMALTVPAVAMHRFAPHWIALLGRLASQGATRPGRYFIGLASAAAIAYVPLALAFTPWTWAERGPLAFQLSRPLLYAVYYFAGLGVGAYGLDSGLLATEGMLARRWAVWLAGALAAFMLWMGLTALTMADAPVAPPIVLQLGSDVSFALAGASGFFFVMAACLRFGAVRSRTLDSLSNNAFGIYLLHYAPVVWLQYGLLGVALFAFAKAMIVFVGALLLAWVATAALRSAPFGSRLIGEEPRIAKGDARREFPLAKADIGVDQSQTAP